MYSQFLLWVNLEIFLDIFCFSLHMSLFYRYVMRKGSRWYSMEMAAVVTHTGAQIIQVAQYEI
jgi:hypothetical protein